MTRATMAMPPTPTPTPIPAFAPVLRVPDEMIARPVEDGFCCEAEVVADWTAIETELLAPEFCGVAGLVETVDNGKEVDVEPSNGL